MANIESTNRRILLILFMLCVEKKIGNKTLRFCSEACAVAYKEPGRTYEEEVGEKVGSKIKGNWLHPVA
jgi:hypothetical protein